MSCKTQHREPLDFATKDGFECIWEEYEKELRRVAASRLSDPAAAEDVVQDVFLRAWRHARTYDQRLGTPRAWLHAILRNVIVDRARALARRPQIAGSYADVAVADDHERRIAGLVVSDAMQRLSEQHRSVIVESYYRDASGSEVARRTGLPIGTVRSRLFYALKALRTALDEVGYER
jgi:RNA polymerase sigma-70 factor (ECF subfamily)